MGISGKDPVEIFKSITLPKFRRVEGLSFLKNRGVTYVTGYGVAERKPDNGSWIREFDLFGLWVLEIKPAGKRT